MQVSLREELSILPVQLEIEKSKRWDQELVFHSGDLYFSYLEKQIQQANKTIDFECYIFERDPLGRRILSLLREAVRRGVQVRLLVDGIGSANWSRHFLSDLIQDGIQARIYHPLPWISIRRLSILKLFRSFRLRTFTKSLWKINRRDHRKVCIIDGKVAFIGGMNVSIVHLQKYLGEHAWRDTSVCVSGTEISRLTDAFQCAWLDSQKLTKTRRQCLIPKRELKHTLIKLNDSRRKRRSYHQELIHRIMQCQNRIWITTPYFVPEFSFIRALRFAVWSGIDVRILLPQKSDVLFMSWANRASYSTLLKAGVRIYEYLPSTLHAKIFIIDDWFTVGSTNRNSRSLIHDLEVDVVLTHSESKQALEQQFLEDLKHSQEITFINWIKRSKINRFLERLTLFFRYWV